MGQSVGARELPAAPQLNTRGDSEGMRASYGSPERGMSSSDDLGTAEPKQADPKQAEPQTDLGGDDSPAVSDTPENEHPTESVPNALPVVDFIIGGSDADQRRRMVGWNILTEGWAAFIRQRVEPYLEVGVSRIILHNPFGILRDEPMQLDQYFSAQEQPGLRMLTGGFADAWRPVTDRGIEVIGYIGCPRLDEDVKEIEEQDGQGAALAFSLACVQPLVDAGMSVALDAAASAREGSLTHQLAEALRSQGVKVYVEARPYANTPQWFGYPVICIDHFWKRSDPERHSDSDAARNDQLTGEILRMVVQYKLPEEWTGTEIEYIQFMSRAIRADRHTPIVLAGSLFPPDAVEELEDKASSAGFD